MTGGSTLFHPSCLLPSIPTPAPARATRTMHLDYLPSRPVAPEPRRFAHGAHVHAPVRALEHLAVIFLPRLNRCRVRSSWGPLRRGWKERRRRPTARMRCASVPRTGSEAAPRRGHGGLGVGRLLRDAGRAARRE